MSKKIPPRGFHHLSVGGGYAEAPQIGRNWDEVLPTCPLMASKDCSAMHPTFPLADEAFLQHYLMWMHLVDVKEVWDRDDIHPVCHLRVCNACPGRYTSPRGLGPSAGPEGSAAARTAMGHSRSSGASGVGAGGHGAWVGRGAVRNESHLNHAVVKRNTK